MGEEGQRKDDNRFPLSFPPHAFFSFTPTLRHSALPLLVFQSMKAERARVNAMHGSDR